MQSSPREIETLKIEIIRILEKFKAENREVDWTLVLQLQNRQQFEEVIDWGLLANEENMEQLRKYQQLISKLDYLQKKLAQDIKASSNITQINSMHDTKVSSHLTQASPIQDIKQLPSLTFSHGSFIDKIAEFGLPIDRDGMCVDIALMALQATLLEDNITLQNRLKLLSEIPKGQLLAQLGEAKKRRANLHAKVRKELQTEWQIKIKSTDTKIVFDKRLSSTEPQLLSRA